MQQTRQSERGIALVAVIFLIVVIAAAVTVMATIGSRNISMGSQALLAYRAEQMAQLGLELTAQQLVEGVSCSDLNGSFNPTVNSSYTVTVSCSSSSYNRPSQSSELISLRIQAFYGQLDDADYVWTEVRAQLEL